MGAFFLTVGSAAAVCVTLASHVVAPPAIPAPHIRAACTAAAPPVGAAFSGPVLQVLDGGTICVAQGADPSQWIQARFADGASGPGPMTAAVFARTVTCVVARQAAVGVVARCTLDGVPLETLAPQTGARTPS